MSDFKTLNDFRKGSYRKFPYQDPTYLSFALLFDWNNKETSPLLAGGAEEFLEGLAENDSQYAERLEDLRNFKKALKTINREMPWYWQSLSGLEKIQQYNPENAYIGGDDAVLEIETLESLNLPITGLMYLYRRAVFDENRWNYIVPANLRKFSMYVYVTEVRSIQFDSKIGGTGSRPYFMAGLKFCEFDLKSGTKTFESLSKNPELSTNTISLKYEKLHKIEARVLNEIITEPDYATSNISPAPESEQNLQDPPVNSENPAQDVKEAQKSRIDKFKDQVQGELEGLAKDKQRELEQEIRNQTINRIPTPENVFSNFIRKVDQDTDINQIGQRLSNTVRENLGPNVYGKSIGDALDSNIVIDLGNVYD